MRSSLGNFLKVGVGFITAMALAVGVLTYAVYDSATEPYYLSVNCGEMGTYKIIPGSIKHAEAGMHTAILFGETGSVKYPVYCTVKTVNFSYTPIKKQTPRPEQGAQ